MNLEIELVKSVLAILHQDGVIDCNDYQGEDFERLIHRAKELPMTPPRDPALVLKDENEKLKAEVARLQVTNKELQHYRDTTVDLWATDRPELIPISLADYFFILTDKKEKVSE